MQTYIIQPPTLPEMNFFAGIIQRFKDSEIFRDFQKLFRNSYFKEQLRTVASTHFSRNFEANFEHIFANLVVIFICLSYCLQKKLISINIHVALYVIY